MDRIGIGIIGARFAADLHAHALSKIRGSKCEIVAVCSKTKESAETRRRRGRSQGPGQEGRLGQSAP